MEENKKFRTIEDKWIKWWEEHSDLYKAWNNDEDRPAYANAPDGQVKKYVLVEFPYPSGSGLHVGHAFSFTGGDVYARFKRMQGYNVMFPMGFDEFGLPTENYAIKVKRKPQEVTRENTDIFKQQMKKLAFSFDWSREVHTSDPDYYKWTQWIFVQLFKKGLAYKQEMPINWCPSCKIGLANEEVLNGKCERCGAEVSRRNISQWVVKITDYADRLTDGLKNTDFIEKVKTAQINWIGRKDGINIDFEVVGTNQKLTVFTTTPVNFGATFLVVAPEHLFVQQIVEGKFGVNQEQIDEIKKYISEARKKGDMERTELNKIKTGVFSGLYAKNHVTGKEIPIWVTDFVLATVGTGAVQGCPGHDQRDWDFAKKFGIPIVRVVGSIDGNDKDINEEPFIVHLGDKGKMVNSDFLNEMDFTEAMRKTMDYFEEKGWGKRVVSYHLRDWIFSRQHYWGEPIPMIYCAKCAKDQKFKIQNSKFKNKEELESKLKNMGWIPVPEDQLPVVLPEVEAYEPTDDGLSPLSRIDSFVNCTCPVCGGSAKRETDTMPNWAGSDWYFLRYMDPHSATKLVDFDLLKKWGPVDIYIGGDEHNTLHLLYSRFIYLFLYDLGVFPKELPEPYYKRVSHGVILGPDNQRMSKSKGNVIVPETVADMYGVDVVRMYLMFMGPFEGTMAWNEKTLMGVKRFLDRFEKLFKEYFGGISQDAELFASDRNTLMIIINKKIELITKDLEEFGYNTAIAKLMELLNDLEKRKIELIRDDMEVLVKMLAPFAPYTAEELWYWLHYDVNKKSDIVIESVHQQSWPVADPAYLADEKVTVAVAINGKLRDQLVVDRDRSNDEKEMVEMAKGSEKIKTWLAGKQVVKEIFVPGRMVNIVVA
ncbi:leucine--tRNA ligase [Candidatus Shapirobacteria bacterium]|nr:leucine--tRNA ligase [Candidatus Shapirobacteria bacterium]